MSACVTYITRVTKIPLKGYAYIFLDNRVMAKTSDFIVVFTVLICSQDYFFPEHSKIVIINVAELFSLFQTTSVF